MKFKLFFIFTLLLLSIGSANAYVIGLNESEDYSLVDIDSDGDIDYVSLYSTNIEWYENDGIGNFDFHSFVVSYAYDFIDTGDIDNDGDIDIVVTEYANDRLYWFENDGSESFTETLINSDLTFVDGVSDVEIVDLDENGNVDIIVASYTSDKIVWFENNGIETFTPTNLRTQNGAKFLQSIDFDSDGDIDIVFYASSYLGWIENDGSESFSIRAISTQAVDDFAVSDLDGDDDFDIVGTYGWMYVFDNNGSEYFTKYLIADFENSYSVEVINIDGDSAPEIITAGDTISYYNDLGGFVFDKITVVPVGTGGIGACDINGDGLNDITYGDPRPTWISNAWSGSETSGTYEINGIVYDALNGSVIKSAMVTLTQSGIDYYDSTDASGIYNKTGFIAGYQTTFNVTKDNYTHDEWSWTAYEGRTYNINQYMMPLNATLNGNGSIHGVVTYDPYHQALENATVTITNATWSNTTATSPYGYYAFHNLTNITNYNISINASGYSTITNTTVSVNGTIIQNFNLEPRLTLTVVARNINTLNLITDYSIIYNGTTYNSVNGSLDITDMDYGVKDLILTADGYYATEKIIYMDSDTTTTILATQILGAGTQYAPHYVKFTLKSLFGTLYEDVTTTVYLGDNASGTLTLTGTTGTDGSVGFMLVENIQYTLTFIDATQGINKEITLYPVDNEYTVYVVASTIIDDLLNPDDEDQAITAINVTVSKTIIDSTTANITVIYNDIMDETNGLTLVLSQSIAGNTTDRTILETATYGTNNSTTHNFTVTDYNGQSYFIEIDLIHDTHGAISRTYGVEFENTDTRFGLAEELVGWFAIIFLTWFALTATQLTVPQTAIGVCGLSTVMMLIGWGYYISTPGLALAWIISVGANMATSKESAA